jgi:uncharacterized protein (DUF1330 family)
MSAYVIVDVDVTDPPLYEEYKELAAPTVAQQGGRYVVRGGAVEVLEGQRTPHRVVVLEFPSVGHARRWWDSAEYGRAKAIRQRAATTEMLVVQGI